MCVGCRKRDAKPALQRFVMRLQADGTALIQEDATGSAAGRGAWVHRHAECLEKAVKRSAFRRALRIPSQVRAELTVQDERPARAGMQSTRQDVGT